MCSTDPADLDDEEPRESITHELKCWPTFFQAILDGRKRHDLRRVDDRDFQVGDQLRLREFDPNLADYTGREQFVVVTYLTSADKPCALSGEALGRDYGILSIAHVRHG